MSREIIRKIGKIGLIVLLFLGFLLAAWFFLKPFRTAKASEYLNSETLIGYQKASILTPFSPLVHLKIGEGYYQRDQREAKKEFKKVIWLCQRFSKLRGIPEYYRAVFYLKKMEVKEALNRGDLGLAEKTLAEILEMDSEEEEVRLYFGEILAAKGEYKEALGQLQGLEDQRAKILSQALEKNSKIASWASQAFFLGLAFWQIGSENLAILSFEEALKIEPNYKDALVFLGKIYLEPSGRSEDLNKAKELLEKAALVDPIDPETFSLLSQAYKKLKKSEEAKRALERARMLGGRE